MREQIATDGQRESGRQLLPGLGMFRGMSTTVRSKVGGTLITCATAITLPALLNAAESDAPAGEAAQAVSVPRPTDKEWQSIEYRFDLMERELRGLLRNRRDQITKRRDALKTTLKNLPDKRSITIFEERHLKLVQHWQADTEDYILSMPLEYYSREQDKLDAFFTEWEQWAYGTKGSKSDPELNALIDGTCAVYEMLLDQQRAMLMTDETGRRYGLYPEERENNPKLTTGQYMAILAKLLKTKADINRFRKLLMLYVHDTPDLSDPTKKGTLLTRREYFQTADETLCRTEFGRMLHDCDDLMIFLIALAEYRDEEWYGLLIPGHALSICIEEDSESMFRATTLCTGGLFTNGVRGGHDPDRGYYLPQGAVEAAGKIFERPNHESEIFRNWSIKNGMKICTGMKIEKDANGKEVRTLIVRNVPLDAVQSFVNYRPAPAPPLEEPQTASAND